MVIRSRTMKTKKKMKEEKEVNGKRKKLKLKPQMENIIVMISLQLCDLNRIKSRKKKQSKE